MSEEDEDICQICFQAFMEEDRHTLYVLDCEHIFHINCVKRWVQDFGNTSCPYCRARMSRGDLEFLIGTLEMEQLNLDDETQPSEHELEEDNDDYAYLIRRISDSDEEDNAN